MRFANNYLLYLGLLIPILIFLYIRKILKNKGGALRFSSLENIKKIKQSNWLRLRHIPVILRMFCIALLIVAVARPQSGRKTTEIMSEGVDIMLVMDTSGSMQALDFKIDEERIDRLKVCKRVVADFIKERKNDRIGMVVFGKDAFTQCPLTLDYDVLLSFLDKLEIGMAGDATAIGSALGLGVKRLEGTKAKSKVLILLTDGRNNTGRLSPEQAADLAQSLDIKVYTIGAGTKGPAPFLVNTMFGQQYIYQEVDIDEDTLRMIAEKTGGQYFRATDTESLKDIYSRIDKMEKTQVRVKEYMEYNELFTWPLIAALSFLIIEIAMSNTIFRKIP